MNCDIFVTLVTEYRRHLYTVTYRYYCILITLNSLSQSFIERLRDNELILSLSCAYIENRLSLPNKFIKCPFHIFCCSLFLFRVFLLFLILIGFYGVWKRAKRIFFRYSFSVRVFSGLRCVGSFSSVSRAGCCWEQITWWGESRDRGYHVIT